jgi:hypothetical protein
MSCMRSVLELSTVPVIRVVTMAVIMTQNPYQAQWLGRAESVTHSGGYNNNNNR